jgi:hypothetical protein
LVKHPNFSGLQLEIEDEGTRMNETKPDSEANLLWEYIPPKPKRRRVLERNLKKERVKVFCDCDLKYHLRGWFKYHIHMHVKVPGPILGQWHEQGFKPLRKGVAHVRFEGSDKKYIFPAYFRNRKVK